MNPIDFEDARDQYGSLEFEDWLRRSTAAIIRREKEIKEEKQRRFDRHPRTRLSRFLIRLSLRIALPKNES